MKVLFVCHYNVGRSQMGAAIYNKLTGGQDADSAGTEVDKPGQTLAQRKLEHAEETKHLYTFDVMKEVGIDVSGNIRTRLSEAMLTGYDKVVNMAEPENTPDWLSKAPGYEYWPVPDPGGISYDLTKQARDDIKIRVKNLITQHPK